MEIVNCRIMAVSFAVVLCLVFSGCAPTNIRTSPGLAGASQRIKIVALAAPDVKVYEVSAGGVHELRDEWSVQGRENVTKAVLDHFRGSPVDVRPLKPGSDTERDVKEVLALFEAVSKSIVIHTYGEQKNPNIFPDKVKNFDYSLGSLESILQESGADALLLVYGVDENATGGKKALNVLGTITGTAVGAFTGVYIAPRMEGTTMRIALADKSGTILWYNIRGGTGTDLRDLVSSADFVNKALEEFPGLGK